MRKLDVDLFVEYRVTRSNRLRNQLVARNLNLAYEVLTEVCNDRARHDWEDLRQVASIGLIKAVEGFDHCRGASFSTYAVPKIRGELQHYLRDKVPLIQGTRSIEGMLRRGKITKVDAAKFRFQIQNVWSLGLKVPQDSDNPPTLEEALAAPESGEWELIESLEREIECLPEPLREVAKLRAESLDLKQIARRMGIGQMAVTRRLARACDRLRKQLI